VEGRRPDEGFLRRRRINNLILFAVLLALVLLLYVVSIVRMKGW
jgi:hypothetical protein